MKQYNTIKTNREINEKIMKWFSLWHTNGSNKYFVRNQEMMRMRYIEGKTLAEIGKKFRLTKERCRQIIEEIIDNLELFTF